jgi:hypothetical protein
MVVKLIKSSKCKERKTIRLYGLSGKEAKLKRVWNGMMTRCNDKTCARYDDWGGRGVAICDEWLSSPQSFIAWALPLYEDGLQLDRIDNDKGYNPENCRFVTPQVNSVNRRIQARNKIGYEGIVKRRCGTFRAMLRNRDVNDNKLTHVGTYLTIKEAVEARNAYIINNNLTNKVQQYE